MTIRNRWDQMRSLIEAGWHSGWGKVYPERFADIDTKQAQHDGSRQIYGDAGTFMRGGEPQ